MRQKSEDRPEIVRDPSRRQGRTLDHDHRYALPARRVELCARADTAGVLGHDAADPVRDEERTVVLFGEGAAGDDDLGVGQRQRPIGRIDEAQEVMVVRARGEGRERLAADCQKDPSGPVRQGRGGCLSGRDRLPEVARAGFPGLTLEGAERGSGGGGGGDRVAAHPGGEGMGRIDDMADAFVAKIAGESLYAAEAADAGWQRLGSGRLRSAGIGIDRRDTAVRERAGQIGRFGGASQKEDARHG